MISYYIAVIRQIETLCIGLCLLLIRCLFTGEDIKSIYPESLKHWGWYYYFFVLWFVVFPYFMIRNNWPHYGIWSMLYDINPLLCWTSLAVTLSISGYTIFMRYHSSKYQKD